MTVTQILLEVAPFKSMTRESLYTHLRALKIKPRGVLQIPRHYPPDTANRLLIRLGFKPKTKSNGHAKKNGHAKSRTR